MADAIARVDLLLEVSILTPDLQLSTLPRVVTQLNTQLKKESLMSQKLPKYQKLGRQAVFVFHLMDLECFMLINLHLILTHILMMIIQDK